MFVFGSDRFAGLGLSVAFEALDASRSVGPRGAARAPRMVAAADVVPDDPLEYRDRLAKDAAEALSQALGADADAATYLRHVQKWADALDGTRPKLPPFSSTLKMAGQRLCLNKTRPLVAPLLTYPWQRGSNAPLEL